MISDKLKEIYKLAQEIRAEAAYNATIAKSAPLRRYYQNEFADGTTIGNITLYSAGFERGIIARAVAYDAMLAKEIGNQ